MLGIFWPSVNMVVFLTLSLIVPPTFSVICLSGVRTIRAIKAGTNKEGIRKTVVDGFTVLHTEIILLKKALENASAQVVDRGETKYIFLHFLIFFVKKK